MKNLMQTETLTNLQLELLRTFSRQVSNDDVLAIRKMLADYFADKAMNLADKAWERNGWKAEDTLRLASGHNRESVTWIVRPGVEN